MPGCPQLNGKAERINRTLMERTRALIFDSDLSNVMWGEAVLTATYIVNRSPSSTVPQLPATMWFKKAQDLSDMKIFGSPAYGKVLTHQSKLMDRSCEGIMVGYGNNCYRLWDLKKKKIVIARDVICHVNPPRSNMDNLEQQTIIIIRSSQSLS